MSESPPAVMEGPERQRALRQLPSELDGDEALFSFDHDGYGLSIVATPERLAQLSR